MSQRPTAAPLRDLLVLSAADAIGQRAHTIVTLRRPLTPGSGTTPSMAPRWLRDVAMVARLTRDFASFYDSPLSGDIAAGTIRRQLATRDARFVAMLERLVYGSAGSPYLALLRAAGCELGDVNALVQAEGMDGALRRLCAAGVYVTLDELKGRADAVRGSRRFRFAETDFDNPHVAGHIETRTGGSRGPGTALRLELAFIADRALTTAIAYAAHGLEAHEGALWQLSGLRPILQYTKAGKTPIAWFHPVEPLPVATRAISLYLAALARVHGHSFPRPTFLDLRDPAAMARWLASRVASGKPVCLTTYASSAVRVSAAAKSSGIDLRGAAFIVIGEPFTESRRKTVEDAGARAIVGYGFNEAGTVGFGCPRHAAADDVHFFANAYGLIQHRREVGGAEVDAYLFTSLLTSGPKVLLNAESGDHGIVETKRCGCRFDELGLDTHVRQIRSFEKLTTEGMTFVHSDLLRILEEVLPARFGGSSADYQLVEETRDDGLAQLVLVVSPSLGALDEDALRRTFLDEIRADGWAETLMAGVWDRAGSVVVRRREPIATKGGKILPFHVT